MDDKRTKKGQSRKNYFRKLRRTISHLYKSHKRATASTINLVFAIATGFVANMLFRLAEFLTSSNSGVSLITATIIMIICIIVLFVIFFLAMYGIEAIKDNFLSLEANDEKYMKQALLSLKELGAKEQAHFNKGIFLVKDKASAELYCTEMTKNIQLVIESCYGFFANTFGETSELVNTRQFETTFFTKSYLDNLLTIIAHENMNHRVPTSISLRATQKDIYSKTLAASIYEGFERTHRPAEMILRENTQYTPKGETEYKELYEGERKKIGQQ